MKELFDSFYNFVMSAIDNAGVYAPLLCSVLIVFESMIPPLPLFVFITVNFLAFGTFWGFIISWLCTCIGCLISYYLVKRFLRNWTIKKIKNIELLNKCLTYIENLSLSKITVILAIPFTPAFMMNIAAGIANMSIKKFLPAILISKIFLIYFWGMIGTSLIESFKNPSSLIAVGVMLVIAYILSIVVKKIFKIE